MDTTTSPPAQRPTTAAITPLLRSVVLCDLVDSTALAERIGDVRIAELMQAHDRLLLRLLLDHQGQLIDKADGVLALFERPVNAAAFALAYQRGLRELGQQLGQPLQARVGIHVGDVMTWTHTPTEVLAGAKPVEVEGLAKPVAARLMGLALPGQILMSGMAQNLAQRAQGELGHIAPKLLWRLHGRYRFKGVPAPMLVHEVGELGIAPLRPPVSTEKAWRELPLWRKPPVLALEVVLAVSLAVGGVWSMLKSPPAIAFSERDWVVVADFNNLTGETLYDEALDTALRVGLEQSRYVNVLSDLQVEQALKRMQREGQRVDRQIGAEIALREGAKAFVLPTVALAGGRPRLSIELIDPASGVTVHTQMHDSADHQGVVGALDEALRSLRAGLGEPLSHIQKVSLPLEQVTTPSLEALRAYGLGRQAQRESRSSDAKALFEQAVLLDPGFAMAHVALGKLLRNAGDQAGFSASLATAKGLEARLSQRERLLLAAELAWDKDPQTRQAAWRGFTAVFPDAFEGYYQFAFLAWGGAHNYREGLRMLEGALSSKNPGYANALYLKGVLHLVLGELDEALRSFEQSEAMGVRGFKRQHGEAYAVERKYADALRVLQNQTETGVANADLLQRMSEALFPLDRGEWEAALTQVDRLIELSTGIGPVRSRALVGARLSLQAYEPGRQFASELQAYLDDAALWLRREDDPSPTFTRIAILATGRMAVQAGLDSLANRAWSLVGEQSLQSARPSMVGMARILRAELLLRDGDPEQAAAVLKPAHDGSELYLSRATLLKAYLQMSAWEEAALEAEWLSSNRGRAYGEWNSDDLLQPAGIVESNLALLAAAEAALGQGKASRCAELLRQFREAWPNPPDWVRPRLSRVACETQ